MSRPLKLLAFDTSTERMSVAVQFADRTWEHAGPGAAQASATLIPALQALLRQAGLRLDELDAIAFGCGPGSFTGLRTACSVAQGLGFGAGVPLLPVPTLLAVAEAARQQHGAQRVLAALDARMDEVYLAHYDFDSGLPCFDADYSLVLPENLRVPADSVLAGNAHGVYGARIAWSGPSYTLLPTAAAILRLCPALLAAGRAVDAEHALPLYIRDKVAKTTVERDAEKQAALLAAAQDRPTA